MGNPPSTLDKLAKLALSTELSTEPLPTGALSFGELRELYQLINRNNAEMQKTRRSLRNAALDMKVTAERLLKDNGHA